MTTLELLRGARALYAACPSHAPACEYPAVGTYCPITAITSTWLSDPIVGSSDADKRFAEAAGVSYGRIPEWNAEHTTEEVLAAFDKAIAAEEAKA